MNRINKNFFSVNRKLLHSDMWLSEKFCRGKAWIDLLGLANHSDGYIRVRGNRIEIKRGQVGYSVEKLRKRWGWSRGKIERWLKELQEDKQIEQQNNRISSVITLVNYNKYQGNQQTDNETESKTDDKTDRQLTIRNNNNKKEEIKKRYNIIPPKIEWIEDRIEEKGYEMVDAEEFFSYWEKKNWERSGKKLKNWALALGTFERNAKRWEKERSTTNRTAGQLTEEEKNIIGLAKHLEKMDYYHTITLEEAKVILKKHGKA